MAVKKIIEINADVANAQKNLEAVNATLEEQRRILIELEQELLKAEKIQSSTAKNNFYAQKAATEQTNHLKESIKDQKLALRDLNIQQRDATGSVKELTSKQADQGKILTALNTVTDGYAGKAAKLYKGSKEGVQALAQVAGKWSITQKLVTAGQWLWNAAIMANPIGAIVAGVVALLAVGYKLISFFMASKTEAEKNTQAVANNEKALRKQTEAMEKNSIAFDRKQKQELAMAKATGASTEAIRALELKLIDEKIAYEKSERAIALNTAGKNRNTLASLRAAGADEETIKKQIEVVNESSKQYKKQNEDVTKALDEKKDIENRHIIEVADAKTKAAEKDRELQISNNQKAKEIRDAKAIQDALDEKKRLDDEEKAKQDSIKKIEAAELDFENSKKSKRELDVQKINEYYNKLTAEAVKYGLNTEILEKARLDKLNAFKVADQLKEDERLKAVKELENETYLTDTELELEKLRVTYEAKFLLAKDNADLIAALTKEKEDKITDIELKAAGKRKVSEDQLNDLKVQAVKDGLSTISNLAELFAGKSEKSQRKAFQVQKTAQIAGATIDTIRGGISAFNALAGIVPIGPALGAAAAAAAVSAGLLNIKKIASTQFQGGGGGSAGSAAASFGAVTTATQAAASSAPNFNVVGDTGVNQLNGLQQPIKAYVVGGEVTTQQQLDRSKIATATL